MSAPTVSIVICTYNRCERLRETLEGLRAQRVATDVHPELIVVDNNSTDGTKAVVQTQSGRLPWPIRYVFEPSQGLSNARNAGMRAAAGAHIAFIDDDITPEPGWLQALHDAFTVSRAEAVCGPIRPRWEVEPADWARQLGRGTIGKLDYGEEPFQIRDGRHPFYGGNMAFRREALERLGGFRTDLGLIGNHPLRCEDTELFDRALATGVTVMYEPRAAVAHWVPRERVTWQYFRRWQYWHGYSCGQFRGDHAAVGRTCRGVPLWTWREVVGRAARLLGCVARGKFIDARDQELRMMFLLGYGRALAERARGTPATAGPE